MKLIAPDYFLQFRCIADKCRHSCCIGWEIDIDPDTREAYRHVSGPFGQRLNAAIDDGPETASFHLDPDERCPMLNKNGLCDLITELGEDALCQICADHPRFRNFFGNRTEIGLGLCCEEAARLILSREEPMRLVTLEDGGDEMTQEEIALHSLRELLIREMQDRNHQVASRLDFMLGLLNAVMPDRELSQWAELFRGLERLDPAWDAVLDGLDKITLPPETLETAFEQFCVYMLYRHMPGALEDNNTVGRMKLAAVSTMMLIFLCGAHTLRHGDCSLEDCIEYARMYSAEIEYSQENIAALLEAFEEEE